LVTIPLILLSELVAKPGFLGEWQEHEPADVKYAQHCDGQRVDEECEPDQSDSYPMSHHGVLLVQSGGSCVGIQIVRVECDIKKPGDQFQVEFVAGRFGSRPSR